MIDYNCYDYDWFNDDDDNDTCNNTERINVHTSSNTSK